MLNSIFKYSFICHNLIVKSYLKLNKALFKTFIANKFYARNLFHELPIRSGKL